MKIKEAYKNDIENANEIIVKQEDKIDRLNYKIEKIREYIEKHIHTLGPKVIPSVDFNFRTLLDILYDEVEIIEEKKVPEKINKSYNIRILDLDKSCIIKDYDMEQLIEMVQDIYDTQDDIIDYLKSKGDE